jgi:hypothetical protein
LWIGIALNTEFSEIFCVKDLLDGVDDTTELVASYLQRGSSTKVDCFEFSFVPIWISKHQSFSSDADFFTEGIDIAEDEFGCLIFSLSGKDVKTTVTTLFFAEWDVDVE